ncbi:MAG TPA: type II secretion system F family protein [Candidatus Bathyarchaeia archaeon]|nr:type II secretion system F family protein [Candidatus Bathyarchaeia archaeon]
MVDFSYIAIDKLGQVKRGVESAPNPAHLRKVMLAKGLELISCDEQKKQGLKFDVDLTDFFRIILHRRITPLEKISFAQHLSIMLKTGVPIIEAVEILGSEAVSYDFIQTIKNLRLELEEGKSISSFLEKENFFSPAHLAILRAGEASGKITESLKRIGDDLKRDYQIIKKIKGAMAYPAIITLTLLGVTIFITVFVLPKVGEVFKQMDIKIPLSTRILLFLGEFIGKNFIYLILGFGVLITLFIYFFRTTKIGSRILGGFISNVPLIKKMVQEISMARFIRSLSSLLSSGVAIGKALEISGQIFVSRHYQKTVSEIGEKVKRGISLTTAFKDHQKTFGGLLIKMCSVGERSGRLAEILEDLALFYEEEVAEKLDNFSVIIEPILMLIVGLGVGVMIISILGPIYQMMGSLTL